MAKCSPRSSSVGKSNYFCVWSRHGHDSLLAKRINLVEDKWFTVDEICKYLNVSNETIYKWIDQIGLPAHKVGRRWMFKREQVDHWVQSGDAALEEKKSPADTVHVE